MGCRRLLRRPRRVYRLWPLLLRFGGKLPTGLAPPEELKSSTPITRQAGTGRPIPQLPNPRGRKRRSSGHNKTPHHRPATNRTPGRTRISNLLILGQTLWPIGWLAILPWQIGRMEHLATRARPDSRSGRVSCVVIADGMPLFSLWGREPNNQWCSADTSGGCRRKET